MVAIAANVVAASLMLFFRFITKDTSPLNNLGSTVMLIVKRFVRDVMPLSMEKFCRRLVGNTKATKTWVRLLVIVNYVVVVSVISFLSTTLIGVACAWVVAAVMR